MKIGILCAIAAAALVVGCTETRQHMGASAENDQNVLTGGPMVGTTIADLPRAVKKTLRQQVPHAEIADIERTYNNGELVYKISFIEPGTNPTIYVRDDGKVLSGSDLMKQDNK